VDNLIKLSAPAEYHLSVYGPDGRIFRNPYPADDCILEKDHQYYAEARRAASFYKAAQSKAIEGIKKIRGTIFGAIPSSATIDKVESKEFLENVIKEAIEKNKDRIINLLSGIDEIQADDLTSFAARVLQLAFYDINPQRKLRVRVGRELREELLAHRENYKDNVGGLSTFLGAFLSRLGFRARCFISTSSHHDLKQVFESMPGVEFVQSGRVVDPKNVTLDRDEPGNIVCKTESINFLNFFSVEDLRQIPEPLNGSTLSVDIVVSRDEGIPSIDDCSREFLEELSKDIPVYFLSSVNKARTAEELNNFFDNINGIHSRFSWAFSSFIHWDTFGAGVPRFRERITTFSLNTAELLDIVRKFDTWFPSLPCSVSNKSEIKELFTPLCEGEPHIQSSEWMVNGVRALEALFGKEVNIVLRGHHIHIASYASADRFTEEECEHLRDINMFSRALAAQKVFFKDGLPKSIDEVGIIDFPLTDDAIHSFTRAARLFGYEGELREKYWVKTDEARLIVLIPTMPFLVRSGTAGAGDSMDLGRVLATQALLGDRVDVRLI